MFIIFFLFLTYTGSLYAYNPGDTFHHGYSIKNNFSCSIKIKKVKKCYQVGNIDSENPKNINILKKVKLRGNQIIQKNNDGPYCTTYNPNYTIAGNTLDSGWDITYYSNNGIIGAQIQSTFEFDFEILGNCIDNGSIVKASINSSMIGKINGICGTSHNTSFSNTPNQNLCSQGKATIVSGNQLWTWNCLGLGYGSSTDTCIANNTKNGGGGSSEELDNGRGIIGTGVLSNTCGDGVLQMPNSLGQYEQCDFGLSEDRGACNISCIWGNLTIPGNNDGDITLPNNGKIILGPKKDIIIGHKKNPFIQILQKPYIKNNSDFAIYFEELCVVLQGIGLSLEGMKIQCEKVGLIKPGEIFSFTHYPNYIGNKEKISGHYDDFILKITLRHKGILYEDAYFSSPFKLRISQPSVITLGGGTSVIQNTSKIANIQKVADESRNNKYKGENTNFVGFGVSKGSISSNSVVITKPDIINNIMNGEKELKKYFYNNFGEIQDIERKSTTNIDDFKMYKGKNNVFILKNSDFKVLGNTFNGLTGERTYIVDNGNITIQGNIFYPNNIALVVRGGNIQIGKNVKHLQGTFITILVNDIGGKIIGIGGETEDILMIQGAIYGNINSLIEKRIHIGEAENGQIHVGTIINFGSNLFRKPAPLISKFITDYLNSQKIAY